MTTHTHRKTKFVQVDRSTLSPHAEAAIMQLLPELYMNSETKKQALAKLQRFKRAIQAVINSVMSHKWREKPPQKRSPAQLAKRQAWFDSKRRERRDEPDSFEDDMPAKTLEQYIEDNRAKPLPVKPAAPAKTWEQIQRETSDHIDVERAAARGERWAIEMLEEE